MLDIFVRPTPKQFFYLVIAYVMVAGILAYFLSGGRIALFASLMSVYLIATAYQLQKVDKVRDKEALSKQWLYFFGIPFGLLCYAVFYDGLLFKEEFVLQKDKLQQVSGLVPKTHTYESRRSGKSSRSFYYLTINNVKLHCSEDDADDCEKIYAHKGKTATVYYQPETKNGNLAYEIVVNDTKPIVVYSFDNQLTSFQENRKKENKQLFFAFILYGLPAFYLLFLYRRVVEQLQEMSDDEKVIFDKENTQENLKNKQIQIKDYGFFGFIVYVLGLILMAFAFTAFVIFSLDKGIALLIISLLMAVIATLMIYFAHNNAKTNRDSRLSYEDNFSFVIQDDYLNNGQNKQEILNHSDTKNFPIFIKDEHQTKEQNTKYLSKYSKNYNQTGYESQSIKIKDFTIFGILSLLLGVFVFLVCLLGFIIALSNSNFGMVLLWLCIGFIAFLMIYKPYQTAILNKDIRIGLYDDYEMYDDEYEEPSLFYKIFRVIALFVLIPLFLLFSYSMIVNIGQGEIMIAVVMICILFVIGYGIKKSL